MSEENLFDFKTEKLKFGPEDAFGNMGFVKNWWVGTMQIGYPEVPESRLGTGIQLAQSCANPSVQTTPEQAATATLLLFTGMWGMLSKSLQYFSEEKTRLEMEISELRIRLTRLEPRKEEHHE